MSNMKTKSTNVLLGVTALVLLIGIAIWQFVLFARFKNAEGLIEVDGGGHHFWWGLSAALMACVVGFFVFSVFLRYDKNDELHITT